MLRDAVKYRAEKQIVTAALPLGELFQTVTRARDCHLRRDPVRHCGIAGVKVDSAEPVPARELETVVDDYAPVILRVDSLQPLC